MKVGIYKTTTTVSSPVSIPLSNPVDKFGDVFKVDKPLLENGIDEAEVIQPEEDEPQNKFSIQNYDGLSLNLKWGLYSPRKQNVINDTQTIIENPFIESFTVSKKRCSLEEVQNPNKNIGTIVQTFSGLNGNSLKIDLEEDIDRYLNLDIKVTDNFNNVHTGHLVVSNYPAEAKINNIYTASGFAYIDYTGTSDLLGVNLYGFTGTNIYGRLTDSNEFRDGNKVKTLNENNSGRIPLYPRRRFHVMACPYDSAGESNAISLVDGVSPDAPSGFFFIPTYDGLDQDKLLGGENYEIKVNYDWVQNPFVDIKYSVFDTGNISSPVSGYAGAIALDQGFLADTVSSDIDDETKFLFNNTMQWQRDTETGTMVEDSGEVYATGAGAKWYDGCPRYSGENGIYKYAYIDTSTCQIKCVTMQEIESGLCPVEGVFSMPIDDPNSDEIIFQSGPNFSQKYEKASTYLREVNQMPAVILTKAQLNKIKEFESVKGWIGLRRKDVGCLEKLFSSKIQNDIFFNEIDFEIDGAPSGYLDKDGDERFFLKNDVGDQWAWVNSSGDHIYKYAGSSGYYNQERQVNMQLEYINDLGEHISRDTQRLIFNRPKLINVAKGEAEGGILSLGYEVENTTYSGNIANPGITKIAVHTGSDSLFEVSADNLFSELIPTETNGGIEGLQKTATIIFGEESLDKIKLLPYDYLGPGEVFNLTEDLGDIELHVSSQVIEYSLDENYNSSSAVVNVDFPKPTRDPKITFGISTKNTIDPPAFINAMMVGQAEEQSASFVLSQPPPATGYFITLNVLGGNDADD